MTIQHVSNKGRRSIMKIEEMNNIKKQALGRGIYGFLLIGLAIFSVILDPVTTFTEWFLRMETGSFIFRMWQEPSYQLYSNVYVFNYTNLPEFLSGKDPKLKLDEIGPFIFQEKRYNFNMSINETTGILKMRPNTSLIFLPELSIADTKDLRVVVPNLALIALSTLATDSLPWWSNKLANSWMKTLDSQLFLNLTVEEYLWGYSDPLVSTASTIFPGWIDFGNIGILDRFYDQKPADMEVEVRNKSNMYSIISWDGSSGLKEQGYHDSNTSMPCNWIKGSYEGLMLTPDQQKDPRIRLFRKQACRVYPFRFDHEGVMDIGIPYYRYALEEASFNSSSDFACQCVDKCLPDGFVDISKCFYNFPIALTKPHYMDADPAEMERYDGLQPDPEKHNSYMDVEPKLGVPLKLRSTVQANIAVRTSPYNTITQPVDKHILPLIWLSMYCDQLPSEISILIQLRIIYGPPAAIILEVVLLSAGCWLQGTSLYRYFVSFSRENTERNWIQVDIEDIHKVNEREKETEAFM